MVRLAGLGQLVLRLFGGHFIGARIDAGIRQ
jgi:hypothetical protein